MLYDVKFLADQTGQFFIFIEVGVIKIKPDVNVSVQVLPKVSGKDTYRVVDLAIDVIKESGVKHIVGPMETTMEGDLDQLLEIVKNVQDVCVEAGAESVMTIVKIDYHPNGVSMDNKLSKYRS